MTRTRALALMAAGMLVAASLGGVGMAVAAPPPLTATTAEADAVAAIGGGSATRVSLDTYRGEPVYDVHVAYQGQVWDVKVQMSGVVVDRHLASESPGVGNAAGSGSSGGGGAGKEHGGGAGASGPAGGVAANGVEFNVKLTVVPAAYAAYASQAVQAVNGVSVKWVKLTERRNGDVQMNVKVRLGHGTAKVEDLFSPSGQLLSQRLPGQKGAGGVAPAGGVAANGVEFNVKLTVVPAAYAVYASQAVQAVNGVSVKWVKLTERRNGDVQMNVKVRLGRGTTKVEDLFSPSGQLLSQRLPGHG